MSLYLQATSVPEYYLPYLHRSRKKKEPSHPQAQLAARGPGRDPLLRRVELSDGRDGGDALATQLRQLVPARGVDVDEAVHVTYAEALYPILRLQLPLRS